MKQSGTHGVNLLPLLDVLLCTMGTLIVILGIINRQVRLQGHGDPEEAAVAREQLDLQIEQLTTAREKTLADLDLSRRRLSGIEEHSRQLTDQLRGLSETAKHLNQANDPNDQKQQALRAELARLNAERARLDEQLKQSRDAAAHQKPCFAIIPFEGIHKTNRRPIYIECRSDAIVLQPEGIVLTQTDFMGPPGPGNPLASALRAAREYWSQVPAGSDTPSEPYPLLLVRPDGIVAYYLAREAMASWGSEFGYEMIEADWKLDFPVQTDARLVEAQRRAIDEARQRLQWLAQASPESFRRGQRAQYRVSSLRGGVVRDGGPSLGNDPFADDPLGGFGRRPGGNGDGSGDPNSRGDRYGGSAYGGGSNAGGGSNNALRTGRGVSGEFADARGNSATNGNGRPGDGSTGGDDRFDDGPSGDGQTQGARAGMPGGASTYPASASSGAAGAHGQQAGMLASGGRPSSEPGQLNSSGGGSTGAGSPDAMSPGQGGADGQSDAGGQSEAGDQSAAGGQNGAAGQAGSAGQPELAAQGMPSPTFNMSPQNSRDRRTASRSMAADRGRNWAMPRTGASVPITRPIRVACSHDRLVVVPDSRDQQEQVIPLGEQTGQSVDQLVAAVRQNTKSWGIAGRGMYWKPQLVLDATPTGVARADDLQILLADSGLDVKRK